jgi:hypothetical protein
MVHQSSVAGPAVTERGGGHAASADTNDSTYLNQEVAQLS